MMLEFNDMQKNAPTQSPENTLDYPQTTENAGTVAEKTQAMCKFTAKTKKMFLIVVASLVACALVALLLCILIIPSIKYNKAMSLMRTGAYKETCKLLVEIPNYKDSGLQLEKMIEQENTLSIYNAQVGDIISFGTYEQDNNSANSKEPIKWIVLDKKNAEILVLSQHCLDSRQYHTRGDNLTWETCSLRDWLNTAFLTDAFSADEQAQIALTKIANEKNIQYDVAGGKSTKDKVFLLSINEANRYLASFNARMTDATAYAKEQGSQVDHNNYAWWWLRSPGLASDYAAYVHNGGAISENGHRIYHHNGSVRPAMWIDLTA